MQKIIKSIKNNPVFIFLLFTSQIIGIVRLIIQITNNYKMMWNIISSFNWFDFITQFIILFILYRVLKSYNKTKNEIQTLSESCEKRIDLINQNWKDAINKSNDHWFKEINSINTTITNNLNEAYRILNLKISYIDFRLENRNLNNDEYIKLLNSKGFSKEDLKDVGVNNKFMETYNDKLLPRIVIEKYIEFKNEFDKFKSETK